MTRCQFCGIAIKDDMRLCVACTVKRAHSQAMKTNPPAGISQDGGAAAISCFVCGERLGKSDANCKKCGTLKQDPDSVLKWYLKAAKDGDDCAQERLAGMYLKGIGTERDFRKALSWYLKSAEQGNDASKAQLGSMYEQGLGVGQDYQQALDYFRDAAEAGNAMALTRLGDMYLLGTGVEKDSERALACFQAAAVKGNGHAQSRLADMLLLGVAVKADPGKAVKWYLKAAQQGDGHGQTQLAALYLQGTIVERDHQKALELYRQAAGQNNSSAQAGLGWMYEKGLGVEKDLKQALEWYKKSASQGHALGQTRLGELYLNGWGVEQDPRKACKFFQKAAEQGNDLAQLRLGTLYCDGNGVDQDTAKGFAWVRKSAEQGNVRAQLLLGGMYRNGKGVMPNAKKSFAWIQRSARQGLVIAQNELGSLYEHGSGVERNLAEAADWYAKAAAGGLDEAQLNLARFYQLGLGVEENIAEAKKWYIQAADKGNERARAELLKMEMEADPKQRLKNRTIAALGGDARAMAEVALMYLDGIGTEKNEENALEWFKKALQNGNEAVRGELQRLQWAIDEKRDVATSAQEETVPAAVPIESAPETEPRPVRASRFPLPAVGMAALGLAVVLSFVLGDGGDADQAGPLTVAAVIAPPGRAFEPAVPSLLALDFDMAEGIRPGHFALKKDEAKPLPTVAPAPVIVQAEPTVLALRHEYRLLDDAAIGAMLGSRNFFEAQRNPAGNFKPSYEPRNAGGSRLIVDRATGLVWTRPPGLARMNLEKVREWIASLNRVGYGSSSDWRLPTVEEAASLLQKNAAGEKNHLDAVFGGGIPATWTGDGLGESRSWIVDFENGVIVEVKNKSRLPALMVSSGAGSLSSQARK